ncbi:hypothetical protein KDK95_20485 [Actinospica sp. MGRD01-02]|uniref:LamG-like jellyroll fold domain-containing protein n=1 Tax=Actinospica acidithermotolerans TaxID=2828514 RepID=A0A941EDL2_9ACTN|nr:LamG-like jellyroll fold domain-containing protein [Actinospica acidithermotolerans]MBR7828698.1 hypothetical protein [Actinospica acidithermotolerans]
MAAATLAASPAYAAPAAHAPAGSTGKPAAAPASAAKLPADAPKLPDGYGPTAAQQRAMAKASAQAHKTGKPVVVSALTTPTWLITAKPGGGFTLTGNTKPVRTQQNGAWVGVDTALHRNTSGGISPAATAYGTETFSDGGDGPLVTTTSSSGGSYSISWPGSLPTPLISGGTATYRNVLSGVDLELTANSTGGFSEVLIVHDAKAAANPKLAALTLAAHSSGGSNIRTGTLAASRDGMALQASSGLEWDSNTTLPADGAKTSASAAATQARIAAADPSSAAAPGLAAHTAPISIGIKPSALTLRPSSTLLTGKNVDWPVYVDPTFSWHPASGASPAFDEVKQDSPCNGVSDYDNSGSSADYGELGVGYVPYATSATCEGIQRAFYQWSLPSVIDGGQIGSATVGVAERWQASFNCSLSRTVNLHWSGGIGSGTNWNTRPGYLGGSDYYDGTASVGAAYNPTGCPDNSTGVPGGFNVQGPIQTSANNHSSQITFALTDDTEEGAQTITDFARFSDNPTLNIAYGHIPNTPTASQLSAYVNSDVASCATATPYPFIGKSIVGSPVNLRAANITSRDGDQLQATFKYWLTSTPGTTYTLKSADNLASNATATASLPSSFTSALTEGENVSWEVQTSNGLWSTAWSPVCTFTAEPTAPDAPTIEDNSTYPNTDTDGATAGGAAGTPGTFQVVDGGTAVATKYYYALDQAIPNSGVPASDTAQPLGTTASSPTDVWALNQSTGTSATDSAGTDPATLQSGASWADDSTRGQVLATNGTSTGYAQTSSTAVPTNADFSVSAWVKLNSVSTVYQTAVSEDASADSAFYLQYDAGDKAWAFAQLSADSATHSYYRAHGSSTPTAGVWYQLTGVYTHSTGAMQLYVNGVLAGTATNPTEFAATGALAIGRSFYDGADADPVNGDISGVQVYSRALTAAEATSMYNATALKITPLDAGPHTLHVEGVDAAGDVSTASDYHFTVASHQTVSCGTFQQCLNNTAISADTAQSAANADGSGNSISATDLANAGWTSAGEVTIDGTPLTLPTFGTGKSDNVLAEDQTVTYNYAAPATGASSLTMLVTATNGGFDLAGGINGDTTTPYVPGGTGVAGTYCFDGTTPLGQCAPQGYVNYASGCASATDNSQPYTLTVPDWNSGPSTLAAVTLPHMNTASGTQNTTDHPKIYAFSVPLYPGCTVQSITLPDDGVLSTSSGSILTSGIHVFSMGTRNTTVGTVESGGSTVATPTYTTSSNATAPYTWTGAWASDTEGNYTFESGNFNNQSFRVLVQPSVTGSTVRIKLDNALGSSPMDIGDATIAPTSGNDITPTPATTAAPVELTFNGGKTTTIPVGGMVYSDPLSYSVTAALWYAVSFELTNSAPDMVQHSWATDSYEYVAPVGSGDSTTQQSGAEFTASGAVNGSFTDLVTGLDVQTENEPTQVVLGDNLIDAWQPNTAPLSPNNGDAIRLSDDLADASATGSVPYGTVNAGIESNQISVDYPETATGGLVGGPSVLSRMDRDVLDEPNVSTVILDEGLEDALTGQSEASLQSAIGDVLGMTSNVIQTSNGGTFLNTIAIGLTPCGTYNGDGATGSGTNANDPCTGTTGGVESVRTTINAFLANTSAPGYFYIDPDTAIGVTSDNPVQLGPLAMVGTSRNNTPSDPVNLSNAGTGALASSVMAAQDIWQMDDGSGQSAADSALTDNSNPYLAVTDQYSSANDLTLNGTTTWPTATVGALSGETVLGLDGSTGYGQTSNTDVLNTAGSFSVSAWAELNAVPSGFETIAAEAGSEASGFYLQYNPNAKSWCMNFMQTDTASTPGQPSVPCSSTTPTAGTWYHLVGTYNAATKTAQLYVNGSLVATSTGITNWSATGSMLIGADQYDASTGDFFNGDVSDVQVFNYALNATQVAALHDQIS